MKKMLMLALVASMLILPVNGAAPAGEEGTAPSALEQEYIPGDVPAQTGAEESMTPAVHALLLAMLNQETDRFDFSDSALTWEGLYNMLSLYGQLDSRCDEQSGELYLPEETVWDYAAALAADHETLGELPADLRDRISYDSVSHCYVIVCGAGDLAGVQADSLRAEDGSLVLTGALVDEAEGETLVRFQAVLQPQDNMFGYTVTALSITD